MKKTILAFALFVSAFSLQLFSQEAQAADEEVKSEDTIITGSADEGSPDLLKGIWHNYDRYVVFDTGSVSQEGSKLIPDIVLRTFYQWYNDRAGEKTSYGRDRNAAETIQAEELQLTFTPLTDELFTSEYGKTVVQEDGDILTAETNNSGAWDITVKYAGHKLGGEDTYHVPVAVQTAFWCVRLLRILNCFHIILRMIPCIISAIGRLIWNIIPRQKRFLQTEPRRIQYLSICVLLSELILARLDAEAKLGISKNPRQ